MLSYYASRLPAVEINNTFYRMPAPSLLEKWTQHVPSNFLFILKAPRRITHEKRLNAADSEVAYFLQVSSVLGERLGPVLFQLPPFQKKDAARLRTFLSLLPKTLRAAFEFRHESWFDSEVSEILALAGAALCYADTEEPLTPPQLSPPWCYVRLRRPDYDETALKQWVERISKVQDAFVFFKHEEEGRGPALAGQFLELSRRGS